MIKKEQIRKINKWKRRTILLGVTAFVLMSILLIQVIMEEKKENERICNAITGTPAWIGFDGRILGYGVMSSGASENQTRINDAELTNYMIENRIKFIYNENCYYCQIQKQIFGEDNFNKLKKEGLALSCNE